MPTIDHPLLKLSLDDDVWRAVDAPGDLFARFEGPNGAEVGVTLVQLPPPREPRELLEQLLAAHTGNLRAGALELEVSDPEVQESAMLLEAGRRHRVQYPAGAWHAVTRYVVSRAEVMLRGGAPCFVAARVSAHAPFHTHPDWLASVIAEARFLPALAALAEPPELGVLYPYLLHPQAATQRDQLLAAQGYPAEGFGHLPRLPNGLHVTVAQDLPDTLRPLFPADLESSGIDLREALATASHRVEALFGSDELPVNVFRTTPFGIPPTWRGGVHAVVRGSDTTALMVVGPSWLAASTAVTGLLYRAASQALGATELMVLMPHRDLLFVFADAGEAANHALAQGIAHAESDGRKPLSPIPIRLSPTGVLGATSAHGVAPQGAAPVGAGGMGAREREAPLARPGGSGLERFLFSLRSGASPDEIRRMFPEVAWEPDPRGRGVVGEVPGIEPFKLVVLESDAQGLRYARMQIGRVGDFSVLEALDHELQRALPSVVLMATSRPWSLAAVRGQLEGRGNERMKMGSPINAKVEGHAEIFGKAVAFKRGPDQAYGLELTYRLE